MKKIKQMEKITGIEEQVQKLAKLYNIRDKSVDELAALHVDDGDV